MPRERRTLTREEAAEFTESLERRAEAIRISLDAWRLVAKRPNDIRPGPGPRFAIVQMALDCAGIGGTYGDVLGAVVVQGNGKPYKIRTHDLAGFVCANDYCEAVPPMELVEAIKENPVSKESESPRGPMDSDSEKAKGPPLRKTTTRDVVEGHSNSSLPFRDLLEVFSGAYPCPAFDSECKTMRWNPTDGHIPRGFLGATGTVDQVELVLVFAEPGDPQPGDHETLEEALRHAFQAFREGNGQFHRNARLLFDLCWPDLSYEEQLRRVWLTESVLCSAEQTTGPVAAVVEQTCAERYLKLQLRFFPDALIVALGNKAATRLMRIGVTNFERAFAFGKPGCFQAGAEPSWRRIADLVMDRRSRNLRP